MSAISSVGSNSSLYSFLQSLQQSSGSSSTAGSSSGVQGTHHHHKHGGGGGGGLMSQIQNAVTSALQSSQSSGSTTDPNQVVQNAIAQVLQNGSTSAATTAAGTSAAGTTASSPQAFFQTLQASGVTPQQFLSDFMAALQSTQSAQLNSGALTGNLVNATA